MNDKIKFNYDKIKKKVLKKPYLYGMVLLLIVIIFPLFMCMLYFIGDNCFVLINTSLTVGDTLSFYGSILAFFGTIVLGFIAVWQNNKANDNNDRITRIEEERYKLEFQPFVIINNWKLTIDNVIDIALMPKTLKQLNIQIGETKSPSKRCTSIKMQFVNTSNSYTMVSYSGAKIYDNEKYILDWSNCISSSNDSKLYLDTCEMGEMSFYSDWDKMKELEGKVIKLELILENRYGESYKESVDIWTIRLSEKGLNHSEGYIYLHPQNYLIEKL
nr:hypothetical protein [uncultured Anaerosporobacter sp.]